MKHIFDLLISILMLMLIVAIADTMWPGSQEAIYTWVAQVILRVNYAIPYLRYYVFYGDFGTALMTIGVLWIVLMFFAWARTNKWL